MKPITYLSALRLILAVGLVCAYTACSSDDATAPTAAAIDAGAKSDAAGGDAGTTTPGTDAAVVAETGSGACTDMVNAGSQVVESAGAGMAPTAAGGTLADGTYVLTKHDVYAPSSPDEHTRKRTWKFAAGKIEVVTDDAGETPMRASGTYTTTANEIVLSMTCPQAASVSLPYTATGNTLVMFDKDSPTDVFTHTKQ